MHCVASIADAMTELRCGPQQLHAAPSADPCILIIDPRQIVRFQLQSGHPHHQLPSMSSKALVWTMQGICR